MKEATMTSTKEALWRTLERLTAEQFKNFKWFLKEGDMENGFPAIAEARLEGADRLDTIDLMVQKYHCPGAVQKTMKILRKINRNDLVQDLSNQSNEDHKISSALPRDDETRRAKLREMKARIDLRIKEKQMKICEVRRTAELSRKSAERQTSDSRRAFEALVASVQSSLDKIIGEIDEKQKMTQKQAGGLIQQLEQEISELTKRSAEVEQLTKDQRDFLPSFSFTNEMLTEARFPQPSYKETVTQLKEKLSKDMEMFLAVTELNRLRQFAVDVTLDPDTAHPNLILSEDGKQVRCGDITQTLPNNPERFDRAINVVGKQSFSSESFYYEVQVKEKTSWDLGVVKESINRKGSMYVSPKNGFWIICLRAGEYKASRVHLSVDSQPKKVGVFVDYENRSVSFYNAESAQLIHCYTDCSFEEKLRPFFSPGTLHGGQNSTPLIICPVYDNCHI
ncbi:pyrin-like isoform X1 [Simochromis diagramma]|uniref:pyrin-like isoform X1 n=2 Tax=Simochromis diagramma TaxID=43689 RepID=UPI001A7EFB09|nr:pyrin-like isoform X1 [Simochromis diagramma]